MSKTIALTTVFEDAVYGVPMSYHVIEHISTEKNLRTDTGSATAVVASYVSKAAHACGMGALSTTALAADRQVGAPLLVAMDAKREEVYWQSFAADGTEASSPAIATACPRIRYPTSPPGCWPRLSASRSAASSIVRPASVSSRRLPRRAKSCTL